MSALVGIARTLSLAIGLAAAIAFHPTSRRRASTLEELATPSVLMLYALVATTIPLIISVQPTMALVVFGLGGLLRFRTQVGSARETSRVILVTVTSLCCGLALYSLAVLTTVCGFVMISVLESEAAGRLVVMGLEQHQLEAAGQDFARALETAGCRVVGERKNVHKGTVALVFLAPRARDVAAIEAQLGGLPAAYSATVHWEGA